MQESVQPVSNWILIFQVLIAPILVAAITSVIANSYLENRKDLRKRKIEAYNNFLEQVNKISPGRISMVWYTNNAHEVYNLQKYVLKIRILGSEKVATMTIILWTHYMGVLKHLGGKNIDEAKEEAKKAFKYLEPLTAAMAQDIQNGLWRRFSNKNGVRVPVD